MSQNVGRLGITLLDVNYKDFAYNDELLINKQTGRLYYKTVLGEIIDIVKDSSPVSDDWVTQIEQKLDKLYNMITENGPIKTIHYKFEIVVEYEEQSVFDIPDSTFNPDTDLLILNIATTMPFEGEHYEINEQNQIVLNGGLSVGDKIYGIIIKDVPQVEGEYRVNGKLLTEKSVTFDKLSDDVRNKIESSSSIIVQKDQPEELKPGTIWIELQSEDGE